MYVSEETVMKAMVQDTYGSADVLELREIERPTIGDDEVLVRVQAAGIHIGDWRLMTGLPYLLRYIGFGLRAPKARVRGLDAAGTVDAVGKNVTRFRPGDAVYGVCDGSLAEYARARATSLALKPANLTFEQAAAVPTSGCTALQSLRDVGRIEAGQRVLIIGASGGVGIFAVQIAKAFGAHVTGVCSTPKLDLVLALGADQVIDYTCEEITSGGHPYDLILDMGGARPLSQLRRALTKRGTAVLVGADGGGVWLGGMGRWLQALVVSPFISQNLRLISATETAADLEYLRALIEAGQVMPVVEQIYPLGESSAAMQHLGSGQARGKLVIAVVPTEAEPLAAITSNAAR
jgi:NADPH:quinone reductase-like Zn-dependent oxidoreductase